MRKEKKIILRFRAANKDFFIAIKKGEKRVETRAATAKYRNMNAGDVVEFVCGAARFRRTVRRAKIFKNISTLLKKHDVTDIVPQANSSKELAAMYASFPAYREKIKKFGIIALEFA
ncbi:MAG: hypothetical protein Q8Q39_05995 [bacterium]|nr:hypothetical protein [bacterium]